MRFFKSMWKDRKGLVYTMILLILGLFSIFNLSTIPIADGFGWDGLQYASITMHFEELISAKSINQYYFGRMFPSVLIHYVYKVTNISLIPRNVLIGFQIYNLLILIVCGVLFHLITKQLKWDNRKIIIGFIALFVNYPMLNLHFYYAPLTDSTVFFLSLLLLYAYLKNNKFLIIVAFLIGFITWPTEFIVGAILYIFSVSVSNDFPSYYDTKNNKLQTYILFALIIFPFLAYMLYFNMHNVMIVGIVKKTIIALNLGQYFNLNLDNIQGSSNKIFTLSGFNLLAATIFNLIFYWLALRIFIKGVNLKKLGRGLLTKPILVSIIIILCIYLILFLIRREITYVDNQFSVMQLFKNISGYSVKFTGQFIISHISYFGPFLIFIILYSKDYLFYISRNSIALSILFIVFIVFSINTESRHLINLYPFFLLFFIEWFDFSKIRRFKLFATILLIVSLLYSKIWLPVKLPHSSFPNPIFDNLNQFPMQYYFMNHGPWQNLEMYLIHLFAGVLVFAMMFYFLPTEKRNNIFAYFSLSKLRNK